MIVMLHKVHIQINKPLKQVLQKPVADLEGGVHPPPPKIRKAYVIQR